MASAQNEVKQLLLWSYIVPVGATWALMSFVPVVGLLSKTATPGSIVAELLFLATGMLGVSLVTIGATLMVAPERRGDFPNLLKGRPGVVALYTTTWLAAYAAFQLSGF